MKRLVAAMSLGSLIWVGSIAFASANPTPAINNANATIQVKPTKVTVTPCTGVTYPTTPTPYETYTFGWTGTETLTGAMLTPTYLTGTFTVPNVVWTINMKTGRGVLTGKALLKGVPATGGKTQTAYSGTLTLITQGLPDQGTGGNGDVPARGWISANTYTANAADGGSLLANVEFEIAPGLSAMGRYGDLNSSLNIPDYSVTFNNQIC